MCIQFTCTSCSHDFTNHCKDKPADSKAIIYSVTTTDNDGESEPNTDSAISTAAALAQPFPDQTKICPGPVFANTRMKCETCIRVKGAIEKLKSLIFRHPFLETDGLSGLEKLAVWERKIVEKTLLGRKKSWEDKAESREERHKCQERIENMGLDGIVDERKEHQGFAMNVTPPKEEKEEVEADDGWWS